MQTALPYGKEFWVKNVLYFWQRKRNLKKATKGYSNPLEPSYYILFEDPFHDPLPKVRDVILRLTGTWVSYVS
jgi:hypothetical protein